MRLNETGGSGGGALAAWAAALCGEAASSDVRLTTTAAKVNDILFGRRLELSTRDSTLQAYTVSHFEAQIFVGSSGLVRSG